MVQKGDTVKVEYTGKLDDGTVFDSSEKQGKPIEFKVGEGQVIKGFDNAVMEMKVGDDKTIKIEPADAYGDRNPQMVQKVPKEKLPNEEITAGMTLMMSLPDGNQMPVQVQEVGESDVTLDMNHPLAGKTLHFDIKLVEVN